MVTSFSSLLEWLSDSFNCPTSSCTSVDGVPFGEIVITSMLRERNGVGDAVGLGVEAGDVRDEGIRL